MCKEMFPYTTYNGLPLFAPAGDDWHEPRCVSGREEDILPTANFAEWWLCPVDAVKNDLDKVSSFVSAIRLHSSCDVAVQRHAFCAGI